MAKGRKTGGRKPGSKNKVTLAVQEFTRSLVEDPTYRAGLLTRLQQHKLSPPIEAMVWHYAYGHPKQTVDLGGTVHHVAKVIHEHRD
jgi:hypothetical protein